MNYAPCNECRGMIGVAMVGALVLMSMSLVVHTEEIAQDSSSAWSGVFTDEQAKRGKAAYDQDCAACHLDDLYGDGIAPALIGASFSFRWSDLSLADMFTAIRSTMPQGAPASLSVSNYVDIVAYMLKANEFPAGTNELPTDEDALSEIIIDEKP